MQRLQAEAAEVDKLKRLASLPLSPPRVCGTCVYRKGGPMFSKCNALLRYTEHAWRECKGKYWMPQPPKLPILVRLKRWLIG